MGIPKLVEASNNLLVGSEEGWDGFVGIIPENVIIFSTDTKKFKRGNGSQRYVNLPDGPTIENIASGQAELLNTLTTLLPEDDDLVIIIDNEAYAVSSTTMGEIMTRISDIITKDGIQESDMDTIVNQLALADINISNEDDNKLAVTGDHQITPGILPDELLILPVVSPINIYGIGIFNDLECTIPMTEMIEKSPYYVKIDAQHDAVDIDDLSFELVSSKAYVSIIPIGRGIFQISSVFSFNGDAVLTTTVSDGENSTSDTITIDESAILVNSIIVSIYGGSGSDAFYGVAIDSNDNIICAGYTGSEGAGSDDALIVKFDHNLTILARKRYGGSGNDYFQAVAIDSTNNIICAGYTGSEGIGSYDGFVVKFDSNLTILARKRYGGSGYDYFYGVAIDSADNIICAGYTTSEGAGGDALVVKFDPNLTILARKRYGGSGIDVFRNVAVGSSDNIICVGYTTSEGSGNDDALVVKFDSNLTILARKRYGGTGIDYFQAVAIDSSDNIICVGQTSSEGAGSYDTLVMKFDPNLTILVRRVYGGSGDDRSYGVAVDSNDNIICVDRANSEGAGSNDALVVKFDPNLVILARKRYGGGGDDQFRSVAVDSDDNIICVGYTSSEGAGGDALVVKFPVTIPSGTFTGTVLTGLTMDDSTLTLADSTLTLADSALTLADSALTLADSTLTQESDTLD